MFERFERDRRLTVGAREADTHRVPLGISFFHPCGLSASLTATYVNQDGRFERTIDGEDVLLSDNDEFWLFDAAINYRLPKRYGFLSIGVRNLFDQRFKYFDTDFDNPRIQPDRMLFARLTLALP